MFLCSFLYHVDQLLHRNAERLCLREQRRGGLVQENVPAARGNLLPGARRHAHADAALLVQDPRVGELADRLDGRCRIDGVDLRNLRRGDDQVVRFVYARDDIAFDHLHDLLKDRLAVIQSVHLLRPVRLIYLVLFIS